MKQVELYAKVRYAVQIEGLSKRAAARRFGIDARTVDKMVEFSVPPGYRRAKPPARPKLGPFIAVIDKILADDRGRPKKQQHTAKRIFERLRDEHGFTGGITIVKDYVAGWRQRSQEMFVPLVCCGHGHLVCKFPINVTVPVRPYAMVFLVEAGFAQQMPAPRASPRSPDRRENRTFLRYAMSGGLNLCRA